MNAAVLYGPIELRYRDWPMLTQICFKLKNVKQLLIDDCLQFGNEMQPDTVDKAMSDDVSKRAHVLFE
jgi:hypothetical protein